EARFPVAPPAAALGDEEVRVERLRFPSVEPPPELEAGDGGLRGAGHGRSSATPWSSPYSRSVRSRSRCTSLSQSFEPRFRRSRRIRICPWLASTRTYIGFF